MPARSSCEEPPSLVARAVSTSRAPAVSCITVPPDDPSARAALRAWLEAIAVLERRALSAATRTRLTDARRICAELDAVLAGTEPGEGRACDRVLHLAVARERVHGICATFACPGGTFIELLVTAPWNVLGPGDPPDPRTVRGAGTALVEAAVAWSLRRGSGGRVALQAENPRAAGFYERMGFRPLRPEDRPLAIVPSGERGWSESILRVAAGRPGAEEARAPWLVLERAAAPAAAADAMARATAC